MTRAMKIVSSRWVLPISRPILENGSVVVADGRIIDLGLRREMVVKYQGSDELFAPGILMPGLINAHIHLELSHLHGIPAPRSNQTFTDWIAALLAKRSEETASSEQRFAAADALLRDQYASGVVLVADIGNERIAELDGSNAESWPEIRRMMEYLAPDRPGCEAARRAIEGLDDDISITGHAPYSTLPELLQLMKDRCRRLQQVFSIHAGECREELDFVQKRTGIFRDFLEQRNRWDGAFSHGEVDCSGTIEYLDRLRLLDGLTLLVHCIHVTNQELELTAKRGTHICICPGSNKFLNVGTAPVAKMFDAGLLPALGTDSPASNPTIDLWREMQLAAEDHPELLPGQILAMATLGGAQALHVEKNYGSLEPGRSSRLLHISSPALAQSKSAEAVLVELVSGGRPSEISWITIE